MNEYEASQLKCGSFVRTAIVLPEVDSTNTYAKQLIRSQDVELPALIVAVDQTAGRGQRDNLWWSGNDSLAFTLILENSDQIHSGVSAIAAAIAVCETVQFFHPSLQPRIKWPNDVLLGGKKLSGILIETLVTPRPVMLVGVGVNTNCSIANARRDLAPIATSLFDLTGQRLGQQNLLLKLLELLNSWISVGPTKGIIDTFMSISEFEKGEPVRVETSRFGIVHGQFVGIGTIGELILSVDGKSFTVESGRIVTAS